MPQFYSIQLNLVKKTKKASANTDYSCLKNAAGNEGEALRGFKQESDVAGFVL